MPQIVVRGCVVAYEVAGTGTPVILLHGGGSSGRQWHSLVAALSREFLCCAPDLFGHGKSSPWVGPAGPSLADYSAIAEALARSFGAPAHLVGHSHGGAVAIRHAMDHPDCLASLTLIEPTLMHLLRVTDNPAWPEAEELGSKHIDAVSRGRSKEVADEFLPYWIGEEAWQSMPDHRRAAIIETMPAVAQFWSSEFAETTPAEDYARLDVPTLLIRGSRTRATAHEVISVLLEVLTNRRLVEVEGAGHMSPFTHVAQVNAAISSFLTEHC